MSDLYERAIELGLDVTELTPEDEIRAKIKAATGKDYFPTPNSAKKKPAPAPFVSQKVRLMIHKQSEDSLPVFVGVNGTGYLLARGEPVDVPLEVEEVLKNAVGLRVEMDPRSGLISRREYQMYPYQRVS